MTPNDDTRDEELLARYRRASEDAAGPSDAVRAAILAESRRVAAELAKQAPPPTFDVSRPAANDSRWKIPAFGTIGAALLAALIFAPRYWENAPPAQVSVAPAPASATAPASVAAQTQDKAEAPKLEEVKPSAPRSRTEPARQSPSESESLQEVVVAKAQRRSSKTAGPPSSNLAPLAAAPPLNEAQSYAAGSATRAGRADSALMPATLLSAAAQGDVAQATSLLDQGAVIDARDEAGRTPLMLAVTQGQIEIVRLLLARGADPSVADNAGHTPLQQARQQNSREITALLEGWQRARSAR
jgi:Ankyrin repeats (many copies)